MLEKLKESYSRVSAGNKMMLKLAIGALLFLVAVHACADEVEVKEKATVQHLAVCTQLGQLAGHEDTERFQSLLFPYMTNPDWQVFIAYHVGKTEGSVLGMAAGLKVPYQVVAAKAFENVCLRSAL